MTTRVTSAGSLGWSDTFGGPVGSYFYKNQSGSNSIGPSFSENGYSVIIQNKRVPGCVIAANGELYYRAFENGIGNPPDIDSGWNDNDFIQLVNAVDGKLRGSDFNLGVTLGEAGKTIGTIAKGATDIATSIHYAKKGNFREAARALGMSRGNDWSGNAASKWLEIKYGWKPLLNDVKNAAESLAFNLNKPQRQSVRSSLTRSATDVINLNNLVSIDRDAYTQVGIIVKIEEEYDLVDNLHLMDPELIAWEVTPYSFVVDWFVPVEAWLSARAAVRNVRGTWIVSRKDYRRVSCSGPSSTFEGQSISGVDGYYRENINFSRSIGKPSIPLPSFKGLEKSLDLTKLITGMALLRTATVGRAQYI